MRSMEKVTEAVMALPAEDGDFAWMLNRDHVIELAEEVDERISSIVRDGLKWKDRALDAEGKLYG